MPRPICIAFLFASAAGTSIAAADVRSASFSSYSQFIYEIGPVPDIDQRRAGLGGDGRNHCVPTSFLNWSAYIAWHGNPEVAPGPDWYSQSVYADVTFNDLLLGIAMQTNPSSGTNVPNALDGALAWFNGTAFPTYVDSPSDTGTTLGSMALAGINGGLVMPRVWWLENTGGNVYDRTGGHVVSMAYVAQSGTAAEIGIMDPASDESPSNLTFQSMPTIDIYDVQYETISYQAPFLEVTWPKMINYAADGREAFIVGYYVLWPLVVLESQVSNLSFGFSSFSRVEPGMSTFDHPAFGDAEILDAILGASPLDVAYAVEATLNDPPSLVYFNRGTNEEYVLGPVSNFEDVASSRHNTFYALDGRFLRCYDPAEPSGSFNTATAVVPDTTVAVTYDDLNDAVVLLDPAQSAVVLYDPNLASGVEPTPFAFPNTVPIDEDSELHALPEGYLIVNPGEVDAWLLTEDPASGRLVAETVSPPGNTQPIASAAPSPAGIVFSINGELVDLTRDAAGDWVVAADSMFNGYPVGDGPIHAGMARTNIDYEDADNPNRADVLPTFAQPREVIERCLADVNFDGFVNPADFNAWVIAFNAGFQEADQNRDGEVTPADFNAWVVNYNAGC